LGPRLPRPSSAEQRLGYQEAISAGTIAAKQLGFPSPQLIAAEEIAANVWCVRFGLAPQGTGRVLEIHVGERGQVLQTVEVVGSGASWFQDAGTPESPR
jgi:hypothetical protein